MGSQYVDFDHIERRLLVALSREFPGRQVSVSYEGARSPRLITAQVDDVVETQETWFIDESFSVMVQELSTKIHRRLPKPGQIAPADRPQITSG